MSIKEKTIQLIDALKSTCQTYGMGNDGNEYKIITQVFLYKFLNDKFGYEIKNVSQKLRDNEKWELIYKSMTNDEILDLFDKLSPDVPRLYPEHLISNLWNQQGKGDFDLIFDSTMTDIAEKNIEIFSTMTDEKTKIPLFEKLTVFVTDDTKRAPFARALVDKLVNFSFEEAFNEHYDFFATIFEYLIKDYNTAGGGKYAEYYTPHSIATIMAQLLVESKQNLHDVEVYDPSAGTGTLLMALAHQVGEDKCTIYSQDISQRSNKMLKLNLILNNLVSSLDHVIQGDTLVAPFHKSDNGQELRQFDYIVSNPPFKTDFSDTRHTIAAMTTRFWAGVPNIPAKEKESMAIYTCFIQHVINSLNSKGKAAVVVPSGFLTDTGTITTNIREKLLTEKWLRAVIQMPTNIFANTNTSVSVIFIDKENKHDKVMMVDASRLGKQEKIDDITKTVFSESDINEIISAVNKKREKAEFSVEVSLDDIAKDGSLIKPGLYFKMNYSVLRNFSPDMNVEIQKMKQRKMGLIRVLRSSYAQKLIVKWFVDFDYSYSGKKHSTEYGEFPEEVELVSLDSLISTALGGEWGKEEPKGNYIYPIRCIRGTDIPNVAKSYYDDIPIRYVQKKHIKEKGITANDIIVEISGGSPIQSTGRICLVKKDTLDDLQSDVLSTNFCRVIRLKDPHMAEYIYNYLLLLYNRGYFFNLENNTTGIKNLIFPAFTGNIRIPLPKDKTLINKFYDELDKYCSNLVL